MMENKQEVNCHDAGRNHGMSRIFYDLCYDQYKRDMDEADKIYQKSGVMLVAVPLLGGVIVALGRIDIVKSCFMSADCCMSVIKFTYLFSSLVAIVLLLVSVASLFYCIYPRQYKTLANMDVWHNWQKGYQNYLKDNKENSESSNRVDPDVAMLHNLCERLVEAQPRNAEINERRRKAFQDSVLASGIALVAIAMQAFFYFIMKVQGI
ncbi:MAG: hypothetical protein HQK86_00100 [Nitrospinae bacterium]|nr:hypothetical protein [Nitrospinota bacterium]MBF0633755.1 hypothetical protein [Nitrospinota bacterium]